MERIQDGQFTSTIYGLIKEQKFAEAAAILQDQLQYFPQSRAALSLLGHCSYQLQDFETAVDCYAELTKLFPEVEHYHLNYAQALHKLCLYEEAMQETQSVTDAKYQKDIIKLQAAIKFSEEDVQSTRALVEQCSPEDPDTLVNQGCLAYLEGNYELARSKFEEANTIAENKPDLLYNIALCSYRLKQFGPAFTCLSEIIERGIKNFPELNVGMTTEGVDVRSVGNTKLLHDTALIEAFNLKAAIEYQLKNYTSALEALTDMPPRQEEELDPVTLHNQALMNIENADLASEGFEKLQFLLQQNPFPPETFGNLLLLYIKFEHYDLAADVLAENAHLTVKYLSQYMYDFIEAVLTQQTSPEEAYGKFEIMATPLTDHLRKLTKQVQDAHKTQQKDLIKKLVAEYDEAMEKYLPVLMAQAKIYWDQKNYAQVEKIFRKSVEFCNEQDAWKLNVAHVLFLQDGKYKEACGFYESIVKKNTDNLLDISPVVLANLCVSYIMTSQNEKAEELMRKLEKEEEIIGYDDPDRKVYHLCIVNLVIGTLYCAKGNFQFGLSRILKSMEPYQRKLGYQTWFYAKRCFCALIEHVAKHMIMLNDSMVQDIFDFFTACELHGRKVLAVEGASLENTQSLEAGKRTVAYEARVLKNVLQKILSQ